MITKTTHPADCGSSQESLAGGGGLTTGNQKQENTHTRVSESRVNTHQTFWVFTLSVKKQKPPHQEGKAGAAGQGKRPARLGQAGAAVERSPLDGTLQTDRDTGQRQCSRGPRRPAVSRAQTAARATSLESRGCRACGVPATDPPQGLPPPLPTMICSRSLD